MKYIINILVLVAILFSPMTFSHSGGTDSNGCHGGSQARHCHSNGGGDSSSSGSAGGVLAVIAVAALVWGITQYEKKYFRTLPQDSVDSQKHITVSPFFPETSGAALPVGLRFSIGF